MYIMGRREISMEHWSNDEQQKKTEWLEENLLQCHVVYHEIRPDLNRNWFVVYLTTQSQYFKTM
jgi:hypothetical protein